MIRYPITLEDLVDRINAVSPTWIRRAKTRTDQYGLARRYTGGREFWGNIKTVYINLQAEKCGYCETKLQGAMLASKNHEVEHYRPKSSIRKWPDTTRSYWRNFAPTWPVGQQSNEGYYKLAYHPLNYAIACTRCNSTLKSNYFPVRGMRDVHGEHPQWLTDEVALLLYPISSIDPDDPEDVITFDGPLAVPKHGKGLRYERAVTNIMFFQLNHEDLTSRRSRELARLCVALEASEVVTTPDGKALAQSVIADFCASSNQFSSCMRAFVSLYRTDPARARTLARLAALTVSP